MLAASIVAVVSAQGSPRTIWVLSAQPQPTITQFDALNFNVLRTVSVPKQAVDHPEYLSVNRNGQLLFVLPSGVALADGDETTGKFWYSKNAAMVAFPRQDSEERRLDWFLDAADDLYVLDARDGTGACSETCPRWSVWAPENGVGDFFLATKFIEGQLQPDYQETRLYRRAGGWQASKQIQIEDPDGNPIELFEPRR